MTENEIKLINLIRENDKPDEALTTAVDIILLFLVQEQSSQGQAPASLQVLA
jgi:hypothetical protein